MVYVPHPDEREDGMGGWKLKSKADKTTKKNKKNAENSGNQQLLIPPGAMTVVGGSGAGQPTMMMMQPPPVEPGSVVIVTQPSQQPGQTGDDSKKKDKGNKEKEDPSKPDDKMLRGGKYILEKHFGICSCLVAALTGFACAPCIYLCCPCDARTVYVANGERYNKVGYSLSCGGCGCLCC